MEKIFLFIVCCISTYNTVNAQLNAGLKLSILTYNNFKFMNPTGFDRSDSYQGLYSMNGGLVENYTFNSTFSVQSELIYNTLGTNFYNTDSYKDGNYGFRTYTSNHFYLVNQYLELPFMGKFSFGNKVTFDIIGGGFVGCLLSAHQSTEDGQFHWAQDTIIISNSPWAEPIITDYPSQNMYSKYTPFNAGILVGLGVTFGNLIFIEFRANRGLVNILKSGPTKITTAQVQFSIGYYIFRQKGKVSKSSN